MLGIHLGLLGLGALLSKVCQQLLHQFNDPARLELVCMRLGRTLLTVVKDVLVAIVLHFQQGLESIAGSVGQSKLAFLKQRSRALAIVALLLHCCNGALQGIGCLGKILHLCRVPLVVLLSLLLGRLQIGLTLGNGLMQTCNFFGERPGLGLQLGDVCGETLHQLLAIRDLLRLARLGVSAELVELGVLDLLGILLLLSFHLHVNQELDDLLYGGDG
mmetsp:Transcript_22391/g.62905  ORF Transcript_22391/g.62905 Transcript_22391/m.62905 type:complete len:217 (-) Transcript_22391:137-787(-)